MHIKRRPGRRKLVQAKRAKSEMVTVEEVAVRLGIGRNQAYEAVQRRQIPALRFGRRWLIPRVAFEKMLLGGEIEAPEPASRRPRKAERHAEAEA